MKTHLIIKSAVIFSLILMATVFSGYNNGCEPIPEETVCTSDKDCGPDETCDSASGACVLSHCGAVGGYCTHFEAACENIGEDTVDVTDDMTFIEWSGMGCPMGKSGQCCLPDKSCEAIGGYCAHFLDTCKDGFGGGTPMDCPLGKSGMCCIPLQ